ncbi:MAG: hypothetical protein KZQ80_16995 [Candidatus Thiodiazotropha sp. (ex Monitilora ramsayi)]|nr:hypothetical protein [Candidatus Thiodiazotropha sp. (ex Monitilora ramsayi)]
MRSINLSRFLPWLLLPLLLVSFQAGAASKVLDRIEIKTEGDDNVISVVFNVPVRYVSHVTNKAKTEVGVQIQIIQNRELDLADLASSDQLTWNPSAEIPLDKVVYQGVVVGTSSLLVSFVTPVDDFRIRQSSDFYAMDFILKKSPGLAEIPVPTGPPAVDLDVPETKSPMSFKSLSLVIYVVNLQSETSPIDMAKIAPVPVEGNQTLYTTKAQVDGREWHRLRLGFFRTQDEAKAKLEEIKNFYPKAWIDRADIEERRQAMFEAGLLDEPETEPAPVQEILPVDERLTKMMELIRHAMTAGEYGKAVRMLEAMLEEPDNYYSKEALELMGLARERNGQIAHAKAEYRSYLEKYPEGEDAERVEQRLLGLITAPKALKEPLRKEEDETPVEWRTYGSFSQNYRRDAINSDFIDDEDSVSRSEIENFINVDSRRRGKEIDLRMNLTGSYVHDLLDDGPGNDETLTEAYVDLQHRDTRASMRLGRQRLRSSGILNRFDGVALGYDLTEDIRLKASAGLPVESSRDVFLNEHKTFAGFSSDISNIFENWDLSLFLIEQRVDDLIDRRAVGGELRYFDANKSLFGILDYDIHFGALNIFSLQGNWTLADKTRLYSNIDYRKSPLLLTSGAVRSYLDPVLYDADITRQVESIEEMLKFETEDSIYQRAEEVAAETTTLLLGVSRPLTETLQVSGDITISSTSDTPQQGVEVEPDPNNPPDGTRQSHDFLAAVEDTGTQYFYNFQVIKNDLLKKGDIGTLSLRYSDTSNSNNYRLGVSSRYPVTNLFRINPRFDISYRDSTDSDSTRLTVSPYLRMEYRLRKSFTLEFDGGANWYKEENDLETTKFTDYFFIAGYRWDF